jgi:hypothetical protein
MVGDRIWTPSWRRQHPADGHVGREDEIAALRDLDDRLGDHGCALRGGVAGSRVLEGAWPLLIASRRGKDEAARDGRMTPIGRIVRRPLREVWRHEELDFTVWLRDNVDVLSEQLPFELVNAEREQAAGNFSVDIVAETSDGRKVVIENQLEKSDHDHLGKVLTYLASFEAAVAIWIVGEPRPEHVQAITWLNQAQLVDFYMFKVDAVVIGDSPPAPLLTRIVGPSRESAAVGETKKEFVERYEIRQRFWTALVPRAAAAGVLRAGRVTTSNWLDIREGPLTWVFIIREHETQVTLYVQSFTPEGNLALVRALEVHREPIEAAFGRPLEWHAAEGRKHAKVLATIPDGGYRDEDDWDMIHQRLLDEMVRLQSAIRPYLKEATAAAQAQRSLASDPAEASMAEPSAPVA